MRSARINDITESADFHFFYLEGEYWTLFHFLVTRSTYDNLIWIKMFRKVTAHFVMLFNFIWTITQHYHANASTSAAGKVKNINSFSMP